LRTAGRQREHLEDLGDYLVRRTFFRGDLGARDIAEFYEAAELAGHVVATRSALFATVLHRGTDPAGRSAALDRLRILDQASAAAGTIGFRFAFAEFCDAVVTHAPDRLAALHRDACQLDFRTRSWIPVECFLGSVGRPLPPIPTQWLEPYEVVNQRWVDHLDAYLARHDATRDAAG
jgi:hypothetical protein